MTITPITNPYDEEDGCRCWAIAICNCFASFKIIMVEASGQWNATTENAKKSIIANGFKLYYYGSDRFFVHGAWAGTIIAPNAQLVLGQTHNKELYGQFYGRGVVVHQYSKVYRVPFNPQKSTTSNTQLDVAWLGVLK